MIAVDDHAIARFRERFEALCRNDPSDAAIRRTILACLENPAATVSSLSESGDRIETVRTRSPFQLRVVVLDAPTGRRVLTVLRGGSRGGAPSRERWKAKRRARLAAEAGSP